MRRIYALLITVGILSSHALSKTSCSFAWYPISKAIEWYPHRLVSYGKIVKVEERYTKLELIDVIDGDAHSSDTIIIWDEKDLECNGPISMGSENIGTVGDSVIIIAPKIDSIRNSWDVIGDYRMPHFYSVKSILRIYNDSASYGDDNIGVEYKKHHLPELIAIVRSYFTTMSIRKSVQKQNPPKQFNIYNRLKGYDLNGKINSYHNTNIDN
jgi:hypothetical protein